MMHDGWFWWMPFSGLLWWVIAGAVLAVILLRGRPQDDTRPPPRARSAQEILDERYARGEIDREEYLTRKDDLAGMTAGQQTGAQGRG
jgi:putative membrane protein